MFENARGEKSPWNPDGLQRGSFRKLDGRLRCGDEHRCIILLVFAGGYERDRAFVLTGSRVPVNAFVKLGGDRKDQRQEQGREHSARDKEPEVLSALVHHVATVLPAFKLRK